MQYIPVVSNTGKPLMPCPGWRANFLVLKGRAVRRFKHGIFYIKLLDRADGIIQPVVVGIDPGSKKEGFTIKSEKHTFLNIQSDAVTWVKENEETSTMMRRNRRNRKTPCRKPKLNRSRGGISPSTKARWSTKLRITTIICKLYPISMFVVEDICAKTKKGQKKWNESFSPLEIGKFWFYGELKKKSIVRLVQGYQTKVERDRLGLKKSKSKMSNKFEAHCIDSWTLANMVFVGNTIPDNKKMIFMVPIRLYRRKLHDLQPVKGNIRRYYGGTRSIGFKRGSWVKHLKHGICYVGGTSNNRISLHDIKTGKRLAQNVKVQDCQFLSFSSWRLWSS